MEGWAMVFEAVFEGFVKASPVSVMNRMLFERMFAASRLDDLFQNVSERQYTHELLFSTVVDLMSLVVTRSRSSINAAYRQQKEEVGVSIQAVYDKLKGIEPRTSREFVRFTAREARVLMDKMKVDRAALLPGYEVRILDGNHLAGTDHRLGVLRGTKAGALPGQSLVLLDPRFGLVTDIFLCEDGHAQERSYVGEVLEVLTERTLIVADRNFCTTRFLFGIEERRASFVIRQHSQNLHWELRGDRRFAGRTTTGLVHEQAVALRDPQTDAELVARRITVTLATPTRDGETEIHLLTNLPKKGADAVNVAELYRQRWQLETAFQEMTVDLKCEIDTLGYPKAALFGFCVAVGCYNLWGALKGAIQATHGEEQARELSNFYLADEIKSVHRGLLIAIPPEHWVPFRDMPIGKFCRLLTRVAEHIDWSTLRKTRRGPKGPKPEPPSAKNKHVSTAKLLAAQRPPQKKKHEDPP
jgi:IS4 transposase